MVLFIGIIIILCVTLLSTTIGFIIEQFDHLTGADKRIKEKIEHRRIEYEKIENEKISRDKEYKYEDVWDKNNELYESDEYAKIIGKYGFFVDLKTKEVILPYQLLNKENLDKPTIKYINKGIIEKIDVDSIIKKQYESKNYLSYNKLNLENINLNSYLNGENYLMMNKEELLNESNINNLIKIFGSLDNYLTIKQNYENLILTKEEYNQYKQYINELREIKIKKLANKYNNNQYATQSHTDHLNQIEQEINNIKKDG